MGHRGSAVFENGEGGALWCMAAVTNRTGIGQHTLRAWERRFGFPLPLRLPSGHRRYTDDQIARLRLIGQAIALGHRAGDVVPLHEDRLKELLRGSEARAAAPPAWEIRIVDKARAFDHEGIAGELAHAVAALGVRAFLRDRLAPLAAAVGAAGRPGGLSIGQGRFLAEILDDTIRALRAPLEHAGQGRPLVFATLPGERHTLGLQAAALVTALAGRRLRIVGAEVPAEEIVAAAQQLQPLAVGVSVTARAADPATATSLNGLHDLLAGRCALWVGGPGARELPGLHGAVERVAGTDDLEGRLRRAAARDDGAAKL